MEVAIVCKPSSQNVKRKVEEFLESKNIKFKSFDTPTNELENFDFIISVGGDGTILKILQEIKNCPPIFGINTGRIGLLTHVSPSEFKTYLERILSGEFEIEECMRLECKISNSSGEVLIRAVNEIAILTSLPAKLIEFSIFIDNVPIDTLRGDGLLISTPIGSTAYALSAGGPIVDPELSSFIIVPIAPFKLKWKPWVINPNRTIKVILHPDKSAFVVADGQKLIKVEPKTEISVFKSKYPAKFFKIKRRLEKIAKNIEEIK